MQGQNTKDIKIKSLRDDEGNTWFKVVPSRALRKSGDPVCWINQTSQEVIVFFPNAGNVFSNPGNFFNGNSGTLSAGQASAQVNVGAPAVGSAYPYVVFCKEAQVYAQGDSEPVIEIV